MSDDNATFEKASPEAQAAYLQWIKACSDVLEISGAPHAGATTFGPSETVALCMFTSVIPRENHVEYMAAMTTMHSTLLAGYAKMANTKPPADKTH